MTRIQDTIYCDGCGVEVTLSPIRVREQDYCCQDCSQGLVCQCGRWMEEDDRVPPGQNSLSSIPSIPDVW